MPAETRFDRRGRAGCDDPARLRHYPTEGRLADAAVRRRPDAGRVARAQLSPGAERARRCARGEPRAEPPVPRARAEAPQAIRPGRPRRLRLHARSPGDVSDGGGLRRVRRRPPAAGHALCASRARSGGAGGHDALGQRARPTRPALRFPNGSSAPSRPGRRS